MAEGILATMFHTPIIHDNIRVLQGGILTAHLLGSVLVLAQVLGKRGVLGCNTESFVQFTYLGLALDRGWYRTLIW